ncbi:hypothetical protein AYI69_g8369, partial [Smittium culicis]
MTDKNFVSDQNKSVNKSSTNILSFSKENCQPISFEGLLEKYWRLTKLKGWSKEVAVTVFKTWLVGSAAEWLYLLETGTPESDNWKLKKWILELETRFPKLNHGYEFKKSSTRQFLSLLNEIPDSLYTQGSIRVIYLETLVKIDKNIAWSVIDTSNIDNMDVKEIMKAVEQKGQLKRSFNYAPKEAISKTSDKITKDKSSTDKEIELLSKKVSELTLLVKSHRTGYNKYPINLKCFNCGENGHTVKDCVKPVNKPLIEKLATEYKAKTKFNEATKSAMFANEIKINDEQEYHALIATKRIRVDDLLDNNFEKVATAISRRGIVKKVHPPVTKTKKKSKTSTNSALPERILDMNVPVSIKELFVIKPKAIDNLIYTLKNIKKSNINKEILLAKGENLNNEVSDDSEGYDEPINARRSKNPTCSYVL